MLKLNNKGQTLVMFVALMPLFIFIMILVIDIGGIILSKQELNDINYMVIDYGLDSNSNESELIELLTLNTTDMSNIAVDIQSGVIKVTTRKEVKGLIGNTFNFKMYEVVSSYEGRIINNRKEIERVR